MPPVNKIDLIITAIIKYVLLLRRNPTTPITVCAVSGPQIFFSLCHNNLEGRVSELKNDALLAHPRTLTTILTANRGG